MKPKFVTCALLGQNLCCTKIVRALSLRTVAAAPREQALFTPYPYSNIAASRFAYCLSSFGQRSPLFSLPQALSGHVVTAGPAAVALPRKAPGEPSDAYLGLLYPTEDYKVFGCG